MQTYSISRVSVRLVRDGGDSGHRERLHGPGDAACILRDHLHGADREHFVALLLNTQHQITDVYTVSIGTVDTSISHPRETFKAAIIAGSAALILGHNHPSGDPTPSPEDRVVTDQLVKAGQILGIEVLDHVIIGDGTDRIHSFAEAGELTAY